jgi:vacuolar-type H+-ATPase subunit E/Vma4
MADRKSLLILVKAERDAAQVVADARNSADEITTVAKEKIDGIQKDMQAELISHKKNLESTITSEYEQKRIESQKHIKSLYNYIDESVDRNRNKAVSAVTKVLAGL